MTKPVTIPNTFATATTAIPLSQLDSDFSTVATALNDANTYSNYAADTGVANAYVVTLTGVSTTYSAGLRIQFKAGAANTGASTLNVNSGGTKNITFQDASALSSGTIAANAIVDVMYDGTQFLLMNDPAGTVGTGDVVGPAGATDNAIVRFDGATGKLVQNSVVTIADSTGDVAGVGALSATGNVSFDGGTFVFNESGADKDFRIEGDTEPNLFFTDASTDRVGIGTSSPGAKLDVRSGATTFGAQISTSGTNTYTPTASTSLAAANLQIIGGNASGACTGMRISQSGSFELFFGAVQEAGGAGAFVWQGYSGSAYAERMRLDSSGNLGIANGNLVISTSGKGIDFSATSSGSGTMTSELLSDYEEGTFTPSLNFGGGSTGLTYNGTYPPAGAYTKIGNMVYVRGAIVLSNKGSSTGQARMGGLPFSASGTPPGYSATWVNITYTGTWTHYVSGTEMYFQQVSTAGTNSAIDNTNFANTSEFRFAFCYQV